MEFKELIDLIESAEMTPRSYTGRGMGDRCCLGVNCDNSVDVPLIIVQAYLENCPTDLNSIQEAMDLIELLKGSKMDSMGRGEIVYWPDIVWEETECDRDYDSEDLDDLDKSMSE